MLCFHCVSGGNTSVDDNPKTDGDDGTSFLGPDGELYLLPLKGSVRSFKWLIYLFHLLCFHVVCNVWRHSENVWGESFPVELLHMIVLCYMDDLMEGDILETCRTNYSIYQQAFR